RRGPESDCAVTEEVRLSVEAEVHRAELGASPDLRDVVLGVPEPRLPVYRLDAERAALVHVPNAALGRVELDDQGVREVGVAPDHVRPKQSPPVPLLHLAVAVFPFSVRESVVKAGVEVPQRDPVEGVGQGFIEVPEAGQRSAEDGFTLECGCMPDDFPVADREPAKVLARYDGPGD